MAKGGSGSGRRGGGGGAGRPAPISQVANTGTSWIDNAILRAERTVLTDGTVEYDGSAQINRTQLSRIFNDNRWTHRDARTGSQVFNRRIGEVSYLVRISTRSGLVQVRVVDETAPAARANR